MIHWIYFIYLKKKNHFTQDSLVKSKAKLCRKMNIISFIEIELKFLLMSLKISNLSENMIKYMEKVYIF